MGVKLVDSDGDVLRELPAAPDGPAAAAAEEEWTLVTIFGPRLLRLTHERARQLAGHLAAGGTFEVTDPSGRHEFVWGGGTTGLMRGRPQAQAVLRAAAFPPMAAAPLPPRGRRGRGA